MRGLRTRHGDEVRPAGRQVRLDRHAVVAFQIAGAVRIEHRAEEVLVRLVVGLRRDLRDFDRAERRVDGRPVIRLEERAECEGKRLQVLRQEDCHLLQLGIVAEQDALHGRIRHAHLEIVRPVGDEAEVVERNEEVVRREELVRVEAVRHRRSVKPDTPRLDERVEGRARRRVRVEKPREPIDIRAQVRVDRELRQLAVVADEAFEVEIAGRRVVDRLGDIRSEAVAVVEILQLAQHAIADSRIPAVVGADLIEVGACLRLREAEHGDELRFEANDVPDVEAAREVVDRDRQHARDEDAPDGLLLHAALDGLVEVLEERIPARHGVIVRIAAGRDELVREVVVLVDDHVHGRRLLRRDNLQQM